MQHAEQTPSNYTYAMISPPQTDPGTEFDARQQEIIKLAKSIFSKRTRTLYHWMYPNASKQLIKRVVASTWEIMSAPERNIYIAQVSGFRIAHSQMPFSHVFTVFVGTRKIRLQQRQPHGKSSTGTNQRVAVGVRDPGLQS